MNKTLTAYLYTHDYLDKLELFSLERRGSYLCGQMLPRIDCYVLQALQLAANLYCAGYTSSLITEKLRLLMPGMNSSSRKMIDICFVEKEGVIFTYRHLLFGDRVTLTVIPEIKRQHDKAQIDTWWIRERRRGVLNEGKQSGKSSAFVV